MNKKFIKTFGALAGIGAVASGTAIGLTSCGNSNTNTIEVTVEKQITKININDTKINVVGTTIAEFLITNKSSDGKFWVTQDVVAVVVNPWLTTDKINVAVTNVEDVPNKGLRITVSIKTVLANSMVGRYTIVMRGLNEKYRYFDSRVFYIDVVK